VDGDERHAVDAAWKAVGVDGTDAVPAAPQAPALLWIAFDDLDLEIGKPMSLQLHAVDPQRQAVTFAVNELPAGLSMTTDGLITGTPTTAGDVRSTFTVTDTGGNATTDNETWWVAKPPSWDQDVAVHLDVPESITIGTPGNITVRAESPNPTRMVVKLYLGGQLKASAISSPGWLVTRQTDSQVDLRMDPAQPMSAAPAPVVVTVVPAGSAGTAYLDVRADLDEGLGDDPDWVNNFLFESIRLLAPPLSSPCAARLRRAAPRANPSVGILRCREPQRPRYSDTRKARDRMDRPRVVVFTLGGTIAMSRSGPGGVTPSLTAAELVASVPGLDELAVTVEYHDVRQLPSASLSFGDLLALAEALDAAVEDGVTGAVVTQGTDTIEETSYLLDLLYRGDAPLVVTGAMRNPTMAGADGPANLLAAIRTAASPIARGLGCLVVFADEVHAARHVRKAHSTSVTAFSSPNAGPIGSVVEGGLRFTSRPERTRHVERPSGDRVPRIALLTAALGDDGEVLRAAAERADGVVVAGFGAGHVASAVVGVLAELVGRVPVVIASRAGAGPVLSSTYGFAGSESDLLARGLISAGSLDPLKSRILLHLLVAGGAGRDEIETAFAAAGGRPPAGD
jgi:L-asparaginase